MGHSYTKRGGCNITLIIQDEGWNKLATFKWNSANLIKQNNIVKTLDDAFGVKLKKKSDIDWIRD